MKNKKRGLKPKIRVLCEGETEKCYFEAIKGQSLLGKNIEIRTIGQISGINKNKIKSIRKKVVYSNSDLKNTHSKVFIVLDIDGDNRGSYSQENISFIKKSLESDDIKVLFSNKNFELWILLHLQECKKVNVKYIDSIRNHKNGDKKYKKGNNACNAKFFAKIIKSSLKEAIKRAKNLEKLHKNKSLKNKVPYTEVYKIFCTNKHGNIEILKNGKIKEGVNV